MTAEAFEALVRRMTTEVPADYFDGVTEVVVSSRTLPHPVRRDIYTLGECIPLPLEGSGVDTIQSRVVLYYGSFRALAQLDPEFDWEGEAWETLTHELRHHVEWRAHRDELESLDRAAEQNYARHDEESFDPAFFLDGDSPAEGVYQVEDDWFLDHLVSRPPQELKVTWHGAEYLVPIPATATLPAYLLVEGMREPPPGDLVVVLRRRPRVLDLFRTRPTFHAVVTVRSLEELR
ncbi:MAG: hypothetical protein ABIZ70_09855 [Gemmatimonadales bacterium]